MKMMTASLRGLTHALYNVLEKLPKPSAGSMDERKWSHGSSEYSSPSSSLGNYRNDVVPVDNENSCAVCGKRNDRRDSEEQGSYVEVIDTDGSTTYRRTGKDYPYPLPSHLR